MNNIFKDIFKKMNLKEEDIENIKFHKYENNEDKADLKNIVFNNKEYPVKRFRKTCSNCKYFIACPIKSKEIRSKNIDRFSTHKFASKYGCEKFLCSFIEYPLVINFNKDRLEENIREELECIYSNKRYNTPNKASLVSVRPLGIGDGEKSYVGLLIGNMPISITYSYSKVDEDISFQVITNPMILIPELKRVVFGAGSYWREIENIEEFDIITDEDINNSFPTKILKEVFKD